jgi:hypothetical protein
MIFKRFLSSFLSTTSKAAVRSNSARATQSPLSQAFDSFVLILKQAVSVLKFFLKPCGQLLVGSVFSFS